ncbi:unnamed protein product [Dicrocoelium dendriticum]|nr:unnamed protein product [Dicrocoelium dendriticum]
MVNEVCVTRDIFRVNHVASFVEGTNALKHEEVVRYLNSLRKSNKIEETSCIVKMDHKRMRVKLENTKETVESFPWNLIKSQAAILNPMDDFKNKFLVMFRLLQCDKGANELHVFTCNTTELAKSFVDSISLHKKESTFRNSSTGTESSHESSTTRQVPTMLLTKKDALIDPNSRKVCNINALINEIEDFEHRLLNALAHTTNGEPREEPPSTEDAIEMIRTMKYMLNMSCATGSSTSDKTRTHLVLRLFNTISWLDGVCKRADVHHYDRDMVVHVREPLLESGTIRAIIDQLSVKRRAFWLSLGPNWNSSSDPATEAENSRASGCDKSQMNTRCDRYCSQKNNRNVDISTRSAGIESSVQTQKPTPPTDSVDDGSPDEVRESNQSSGKESNVNNTYIATVRHVGSKKTELDVAPGTVLEVRDKSNVDWWLVRTQNGEEGEVPRWKLQEYNSECGTTGAEALFSHKTPSKISSKQSSSLCLSSTGTNDGVKPTGSPTSVVHSDHGSNISTSTSQTVPLLLIQPDVDKGAVGSQRDDAKTAEKPLVISTSKSVDTGTQGKCSTVAANMIYMTPEQLHEWVQTANHHPVPMVLVPLSELPNYASQVGGYVSNNESCIEPNFSIRWHEMNETDDHTELFRIQSASTMIPTIFPTVAICCVFPQLPTRTQ